jgi:hypothetical protein
MRVLVSGSRGRESEEIVRYDAGRDRAKPLPPGGDRSGLVDGDVGGPNVSVGAGEHVVPVVIDPGRLTHEVVATDLRPGAAAAGDAREPAAGIGEVLEQASSSAGKGARDDERAQLAQNSRTPGAPSTSAPMRLAAAWPAVLNCKTGSGGGGIWVRFRRVDAADGGAGQISIK